VGQTTGNRASREVDPLLRRLRLPAIAIRLTLILGLLAGINDLIFSRFEHRAITPLESLFFILETMTSTGFGTLAPLASPITQLWTILLMVVGFVLMGLLLTALIQQWALQVIAEQPPRRAPKPQAPPVVIIGSGPIGRYLAEACRAAGQPYLLLDRDQERLTAAMQDGLRTLGGDPERAETLRRAQLASARALVVTERDPANASLLLLSRSVRPDLERYATQESVPPALLKRAGATRVVSAKRRLGERLGYLAIAPYANDLDLIQRRVGEIRYVTIPVLPGSWLDGKRLAEATFEREVGVTVLGLLTRGHFVPAVQGDRRLHPGDLLIAAGRPEQLTTLEAVCGARLLTPPVEEGPVLIIGSGFVARAAAGYLRARGVPVWMLATDRRGGS
jgi:Trk K+ transport system NAD-binding subunit